jgi:sortase A
MKRKLRRALLVMGGLLVVLGLSYGALVGYLMWRESSSPSTRQVLVLKDGRQIPLIQPTAAPRPPPPTAPATAPALSPDAVVADLPPTPTAPLALPTEPPAPSYLPPLRIVIPRLGVDWPVVLADNNHMPRFKGVGWLMGSGFPGTPGNLVLFGHLDGPYATLGRLHELVAGDEFAVRTESGTARYQVSESREVLPDAVEVLAPTTDATATLITCSGDWDTLDGMYNHRLVVTGTYIGP